MMARSSLPMAAAWLLLLGTAAATAGGKPTDPWETLAASFSGMRGQVEVGGPCAGAEFHGSRPLPARISFYYPVANSIDLST
ncbi:MAG TPA: hypothetical protein PL181_05970, partial [bacterium]|nr:hypothetical protein [bacterium]